MPPAYKYVRLASGELVPVDPGMLPGAVGLLDEPPAPADPVEEYLASLDPQGRIPRAGADPTVAYGAAPRTPHRPQLEDADAAVAQLQAMDAAAEAAARMPTKASPAFRTLAPPGVNFAEPVQEAVEDAPKVAGEEAPAPGGGTVEASLSLMQPPSPRGVGLTKSQRDELALREDAAKEMQSAQARMAGEVSGVLKGAMDADDRYQREAVAREQFSRDRVYQRRKSYETANATLIKMEDFQDPWSSRSAGAQILGALGVFLGELGRGLIGGENTALKILNDSIDRALEVQRLNYGKAGKQADAALTAYEMALRDGADERQADNQFRASIWDWADRKLKVLEAKATGEMVKANYMLGRAEINKIKNGYLKDNEDREALRASREFDARLKMQETAQKAAGEDKLAGAGLTGTPVSAVALTQATEMRGAAESLRGLFDRIDAHREEFGAAVWPGTEQNRAGKSLATQLWLEFKDLARLGVLAGPDIALLKTLVPENIAGWAQGNIGAQLDEAKDYVLGKATAYLAARGLSETGTASAQSMQPAAKAGKRAADAKINSALDLGDPVAGAK